MTVARVAGGGGLWTWGRSGRLEAEHHGWAAPRMGPRWSLSRGPGMAPDTRTSSTSRSPGWRPSVRESAITELMRIAWRTVGAIITRVWADVEPCTTGLPAYAGSGLTRSPCAMRR